ncbi:hypothetical protein DFQ12_3083 [Sphingobacterium detergens]|uniref:Uncharacterized protein n=1 Tax=Sphingobacterium detergens TaxID=1145106 RepID=A0A420B7Z9_SPHD1|nr:hypothetical protein DFQ12_3083 [Sphingobacterium detergens]
MLIITLIGLFGIISVAIAIYINLRGKWADMPNYNRRKNHQIIYNERASGWRLFSFFGHRIYSCRLLGIFVNLIME